jgi:hypothetical protein
MGVIEPRKGGKADGRQERDQFQEKYIEAVAEVPPRRQWSLHDPPIRAAASSDDGEGVEVSGSRR